MGQKPTMTFPDYATTQRAGGGNSAGPLLENLIHEFVIGEERRCLARFIIDEIAPQVFVLSPKSLRVIGGHNLLDHPTNVFLPGLYTSFTEASNAAKTWATAINETSP